MMSLDTLLSFLPNQAVSEIMGFLAPFPFSPLTFNNERLVQTVSQLYQYCKKNGCSLDISGYREYYTEVYDLQSRGSTIERFRVLYYEQNRTSVRQLWTFTFIRNGQEKNESYFLKECVEAPIHGFLDGNEFETIYPDYEDRRELVPMADWDSWKALPGVHVFYREFLYPLFTQVVQTCCLFDSDLTILDLGGSDGELSLKLAALTHVHKVLLLDQSAIAIQNALVNKRNGGHWDKIFPSQCDILDFGQVSQLVEFDSCDMILLSGVVNKNVMTKRNAHWVLEICKNFLKPEGLILISGFTEPFFHSEDYEDMGFTVLNKSVWHAEKQDSVPFYVLMV